MCRPSSRFPSIASVAQPCPQHLRSQRDAPVEGSVPGAPTVVVHVLEDRTIYACAETSPWAVVTRTVSLSYRLPSYLSISAIAPAGTS